MDLSIISDAFGATWFVWLIVLFAGVVFWAFWPRHKRRREEPPRYPFQDDESGG